MNIVLHHQIFVPALRSQVSFQPDDELAHDVRQRLVWLDLPGNHLAVFLDFWFGLSAVLGTLLHFDLVKYLESFLLFL